jgi:hypothetical protein
MAKQTLNGVVNYYGPRTSFDGASGTEGRRSNESLLVMFIGGQDITVQAQLPAGAMITGAAVVEVTEAFALGGTTPVLNIGVVGSEGTNRLAQLSEAQAEAIGTYGISSAGTLALNTPLAAAATIGVALGGTSPTNAGVGKLKIAIPYTAI